MKLLIQALALLASSYGYAADLTGEMYIEPHEDARTEVQSVCHTSAVTFKDSKEYFKFDGKLLVRKIYFNCESESAK